MEKGGRGGEHTYHHFSLKVKMFTLKNAKFLLNIVEIYARKRDEKFACPPLSESTFVIESMGTITRFISDENGCI